MATVTVAYQSVGPGEVLLDSFPGADDDAKLQAAMAYCAAQTYKPVIRLGMRLYSFNKSIGQPYGGFMLIGYSIGMGANVVDAADRPNTTRVKLAVPAESGNKAGIWINGTGRVNHMVIANILFYSTPFNRTQIIRASYAAGSGLYACTFYNVSVQGCYSFLGNSDEACDMTLCHIYGTNNLQVTADTMCNIGGADNRGLFVGNTNIFLSDDFTPVANFKYCMMFSNLAKSHVGSMYITAASSWRGLYISSYVPQDNGAGIIINAPILEGDTPGANPGPCDGALMRIDVNARVTIRDAVIDSALGSPSGSASKNKNGIEDGALVEIAGTARVLMDGTLFGHYGKPVTTPVVRVTDTAELIIRNSGKYVYSGGTPWNGASPIVKQDTAGQVIADETVTVQTATT